VSRRDAPSENEADFREKYLALRSDYEAVYRELVRQNDARFAPRRTDPRAPLEAHCRQYFVDPFLEALNWRLNTSDQGAPNAFPESRVASASRGTVLRLDYLGVERGTTTPLMIVETKSPDSAFPRLRQPLSSQSFERSESRSPALVIAAGLKGAALTGNWNEWLSDLRSYVKDIWKGSQIVPTRVVLTNARWLIIFTDPDNSFLHFDEHDHRVDDQAILVFQYDRTRDEFQSRCQNIFNLLEYRHVVGEAPWIKVIQLRAHIGDERVTRAMHGLWIRHSVDADRRRGEPSPKIRVQPVVLLQLGHDTWLTVETGREPPFEVPDESGKLPGHLRAVRKEAFQLLKDINKSLGATITVDEVSNHYRDERSFRILPGVKKLVSHGPTQEFLLVTGKSTHFLKQPERIVSSCKYHDWSNSSKQGCAEPPSGPIMLRSAKDRSFFKSTERHHCTHSDVAAIKRIPASTVGPGRLRSDNPNGRFCEIWPFEQHLCCRTCAFEDACAQERVFTLPCKKVDRGHD